MRAQLCLGLTGFRRAVREFLTIKLGALEHELFAVLLLDNRHRLIDYVELFRGTIDAASVHPREVVKLALARNAAALVLAHPHPLCCAQGVTTGLRVTQFEARTRFGARQDR
jgi:DNA repair protein RadC